MKKGKQWQVGTLYHGSDHEFEPGDLVLPSSATGLVKRGNDPDAFAHAAEDPNFAKVFGKHLYEVEHPEGVDPAKTVYNPSIAHLLDGERKYGSSKGFKVIRRVSE